MKKLLSKQSQRGFSLMEVLVFTAILSLFFIATATIVTYMLRTAKINEHKILATRYAEELMEWLRAERDIDWNAFTTHASNTGTVNCFGSEPPNWSSSCGYNLDGVFKRTVTLTSYSASGFIYQVNIAVAVEWVEGGKLYTIPLNTTFAILER